MGALARHFCSIQRYKPHVIRPAIQAKLSKPFGVEGQRGIALRIDVQELGHLLHGGMSGDHGP